MRSWAIIFFSTLISSCGSGGSCEVFKSATVQSPDGKWLAISHADSCGGGIGTGYVINRIDLRSETAGTHTVLAPEGQWQSSELPSLVWVDNKTLEVSVPNRSLFDLREASYQGIAIQVRFEHDDPADRDKWLTWRKQNIDSVNGHLPGPQPQPPALPLSQ